MSSLQLILFILSVLNLIPIALMIYYKKSNWALALSFIEIFLVFLASGT